MMRGRKTEPLRDARRWRLRARLVALGVGPVVASGALAAVLFLLFGGATPKRHWVMLAAAVAASAAAGLVAAFALARRITRPFEAMLRFADGEDEMAVRGALRENASWEIYQLFRRVQQLVQQNRAGHRALEEVEDVAREAARLAGVLASIHHEIPEALPKMTGSLAPVEAALAEFFRRRGRVRHEADELARQLGETLRELRASVGELASRSEKGYLAATGAAFAGREMERRIDAALRPTAPSEEPWNAARLAADEAGRIENRLAVLALRHADDAPGELLTDLRGAIERVRSLEMGTREALEKMEPSFGASRNGYRVSQAGVEALREKIEDLTARIAEASAALESTSRVAERARRLAAHAAREVEGFRRHLESEPPEP